MRVIILLLLIAVSAKAQPAGDSFKKRYPGVSVTQGEGWHVPSFALGDLQSTHKSIRGQVSKQCEASGEPLIRLEVRKSAAEGFVDRQAKESFAPGTLNNNGSATLDYALRLSSSSVHSTTVLMEYAPAKAGVHQFITSDTGEKVRELFPILSMPCPSKNLDLRSFLTQILGNGSRDAGDAVSRYIRNAGGPLPALTLSIGQSAAGWSPTLAHTARGGLSIELKSDQLSNGPEADSLFGRLVSLLDQQGVWPQQYGYKTENGQVHTQATYESERAQVSLELSKREQGLRIAVVVQPAN